MYKLLGPKVDPFLFLTASQRKKLLGLICLPDLDAKTYYSALKTANKQKASKAALFTQRIVFSAIKCEDNTWLKYMCCSGQ